MNPTASAVARIAGVAIVLILAAALGLIAGNALNARDDAGIGAAGPALQPMDAFEGARYTPVQRDAATVETPSYADPYRLLVEEGRADAATVVPQTWGNIDERRDARSSDQPSERESLTAPIPR